MLVIALCTNPYCMWKCSANDYQPLSCIHVAFCNLHVADTHPVQAILHWLYANHTDASAACAVDVISYKHFVQIYRFISYKCTSRSSIVAGVLYTALKNSCYIV